MKKFILFFAAILISGIGLAQTTVTGTVVDSEIGTGLPGATIVVKGTSDGVSSDFNGSFSISVDSGATLVVSYVGYASQEVVVGESANVGIIQLQPGDNILSGGYYINTFEEFYKDLEIGEIYLSSIKSPSLKFESMSFISILKPYFALK